ncbi:MAG: hypothetical protein ACK56I_26560, partial [bacterium]
MAPPLRLEHLQIAGRMLGLLQLADQIAAIAAQPQRRLIQLPHAEPVIPHPLAQAPLQQQLRAASSRPTRPLLAPGLPGFIAQIEAPKPIQLGIAAGQRLPAGHHLGHSGRIQPQVVLPQPQRRPPAVV